MSQGGPNFYMFSPNSLYEIHIDNNGDAVEDLTFQFRFNNTSKATELTVGGKRVKIPLINSGPISGVNPAALNVRETFTIDVVRGTRRSTSRQRLTNAAGGATEFDKPVDNIGDKTFGGAGAYAVYANQHITTWRFLVARRRAACSSGSARSHFLSRWEEYSICSI
jgi:hypothetical protein